MGSAFVIIYHYIESVSVLDVPEAGPRSFLSFAPVGHLTFFLGSPRSPKPPLSFCRDEV